MAGVRCLCLCVCVCVTTFDEQRTRVWRQVYADELALSRSTRAPTTTTEAVCMNDKVHGWYGPSRRKTQDLTV